MKRKKGKERKEDKERGVMSGRVIKVLDILGIIVQVLDIMGLDILETTLSTDPSIPVRPWHALIAQRELISGVELIL